MRKPELGRDENQHSRKRVLGKFHIAVLLAAMSGCSTVSYAPGDQLPGIQLAASGPYVMFAWADDSPLATQLSSYTRFDLVAQYQTAAGPVTGETLAASVPQGNQVQFSLPDTLRNPPLGEVCLRMVINQRQAIPLRVAGVGGSVDGFRYAGWEQQASIATTRQLLLEQQTDLARMNREAEGVNQSFDSWRDAESIASVADCEKLGGDTITAARPASVLDAAEWPTAARRECVWRSKLSFDIDIAKDIHDSIKRALDEEKAKGSAAQPGEIARLSARLAEAAALVSDISRYDLETGDGYSVLTAARELPFTSVTRDLIGKYDGRVVTQALSLGILTAYESCLTATEAQFRLSLETWQKEQDSRLTQGRAEVERQECRARFTSAATLQDSIARRQVELDGIAAQLEQLGRMETAALPEMLPLHDQVCHLGQ